MEKLFITDRDGKEVEVTDLEAALNQAYRAIEFHLEAEKTKKKTGEGIIYPEVHKDWEHTRDRLEELRSQQLQTKLEKEGWDCTDPDSNQFVKTVKEGRIYDFREDRIIHPETLETEVFEFTINLDHYSKDQIYAACCDSFGYKKKGVDKWIEEGSNNDKALIAECLFELE